MIGVFETRAGILFPDDVITANLEFAAAHGVALHTGVVVEGWEEVGGGVELRTTTGRHRARQLVIAAGGWTVSLLRDLGLPLEVERQVIHWATPTRFPEHHAPARMPCSLWQLPTGELFYTKPDLGDGVKIGWHHGGAITTPEAIDRRVSAHEDAAIFDLLRRFVPFAKGEIRDRAVCMYTNTPDRHFVIDRLPASSCALVVSACSGHGFKYAPVIAEAVVGLIESGSSPHDLTPFQLARFAAGHQSPVG